jgi:hypothetical protein
LVKGTPAWVYKQALILNCNHLLYIIIHSYYIYICPYGFGYYIPDILGLILCERTLFVSAMRDAKKARLKMQYCVTKEEVEWIIKDWPV